MIFSYKIVFIKILKINIFSATYFFSKHFQIT